MAVVHPPCADHAPVARVELADVVRRFGDDLRRQPRLSHQAQRVLDAVTACRTPALGGHRFDCAHCGHRHYVYHSCRNRHCPKCQQLAKARWLEARQAELLPVPYFHLVFTLPHEFNSIVLGHRRVMLGHLFAAAAQTLTEFGRRRFRGRVASGGRVGFTSVLHTWDQKLGAHFHLHVLIAGGALSDDQRRWVHARPNFLFPVHALSVAFRGKFMALARPLISEQAVINRLYAKPWIVYAKKPFAGPRKLLDYLGRYTHRVAISNHRLLAIEGDQVVFRYRDRPAGDVLRTMRLPGVEFLRRFLLHVLPPGLQRIRHYGFLANRGKAQALARCRQLLGQVHAAAAPTTQTVQRWLLLLTGRDVSRCPRCGKAGLLQTPVEPCKPRLGLSTFRGRFRGREPPAMGVCCPG
jgi:hypothetical protein